MRQKYQLTTKSSGGGSSSWVKLKIPQDFAHPYLLHHSYPNPKKNLVIANVDPKEVIRDIPIPIDVVVAAARQ